MYPRCINPKLAPSWLFPAVRSRTIEILCLPSGLHTTDGSRVDIWTQLDASPHSRPDTRRVVVQFDKPGTCLLRKISHTPLTSSGKLELDQKHILQIDTALSALRQKMLTFTSLFYTHLYSLDLYVISFKAHSPLYTKLLMWKMCFDHKLSSTKIQY